MKKGKFLKYLSCGVFASLYILVAVISLICSTEFFALAHSGVMSWVLAIGFEIGAMSCLLSTLILPRNKQALVWIMFVILTLFQCMSNTYMAYAHLENFSGWVELFGLNELETMSQKRILASISGAILPLVALGFIRIMANILGSNEQPTNLQESEQETSEPVLFGASNNVEEETIVENKEQENKLKNGISGTYGPIDTFNEVKGEPSEVVEEEIGGPTTIKNFWKTKKNEIETTKKVDTKMPQVPEKMVRTYNPSTNEYMN